MPAPAAAAARAVVGGGGGAVVGGSVGGGGGGAVVGAAVVAGRVVVGAAVDAVVPSADARAGCSGASGRPGPVDAGHAVIVTATVSTAEAATRAAPAHRLAPPPSTPMV